jgi:glycosyltransferase involved in cell wall biosynthesis
MKAHDHELEYRPNFSAATMEVRSALKAEPAALNRPPADDRSEDSRSSRSVTQLPTIEVALLTGGQDRHYAAGLAMSLVERGICLDIIGSDEVDGPEFHGDPRINFLNLRGDQRGNANLWTKVTRVTKYYGRLLRYGVTAKPKVFHILWNNKFEYFDRTLLMLYYKIMGKKLVLTAHNVNAAKRDSSDSWLNRATLRIQYHLADQIFVHTEKMKSEVVDGFGVRETSVTIIPYPINNAIPWTDLTQVEARHRLGIGPDRKTILFFGNIAPYKGLDVLATAFQKLAAGNKDYSLIIAGKPKNGCEDYLQKIRSSLAELVDAGQVIEKIGHIPDEDAEMYFKAADVLALPYIQIFQSGILFFAFNFGLPVVASDVGSFRDDVIESKTGFLCKPGDSADLVAGIEKYFQGELFKHLGKNRQEIRTFVEDRHSWSVVAEMTRDVHARLAGLNL